MSNSCRWLRRCDWRTLDERKGVEWHGSKHCADRVLDPDGQLLDADGRLGDVPTIPTPAHPMVVTDTVDDHSPHGNGI